MLERPGSVLCLVDSRGLLGDPQRHELRSQVVEITGERALLCDLAERRDRRRVMDLATARDRLA